MSGCEQSQQTSSLFDHLVGGGEHRLRHGQAERLGGLEVDHQLEARRLFDWEIARIGVECARDGGQLASWELTGAAGLSEDESHGQAPHP
jgi:hypothetical protein